MADKKKKPVKPVTKPFLTGSPADSRTGKSALAFFGTMVLITILCFLVSSMLSLGNVYLRILLNGVLVVLVLLILWNNAAGKGTEAVARGEILYQRQEQGKPFSDSERAMAFHPAKGFLIALLGTLPLLICCILLSVTADKQITGIGTLPSWVSAYQSRPEIGDALVAYTTPPSMTLEDVMRLIVRIMLMPLVTMIGGENGDLLLLVEKLSPVLILLPACAYGLGYLQGRNVRTQVHTEIAQNRKTRARREKKEQKARRNAVPKGPQQLN